MAVPFHPSQDESILVPIFPIAKVSAAPALFVLLSLHRGATFLLLLLLLVVEIAAATGTAATAATATPALGTARASTPALDRASRIAEARYGTSAHRWHRLGEAFEGTR